MFKLMQFSARKSDTRKNKFLYYEPHNTFIKMKQRTCVQNIYTKLFFSLLNLDSNNFHWLYFYYFNIYFFFKDVTVVQLTTLESGKDFYHFFISSTIDS